MNARTAILITAASSLLLATSCWAATSVKSGKSNTSDRTQGLSVTSTTNLSGPSDVKTVYTTGVWDDFVLTGICVSPTVSGGIRLNVDGFGTIAHLGTLGDNGCYTFSQGVLLPRNSTVTCSTSAGASPGNYFCTITGVE